MNKLFVLLVLGLFALNLLSISVHADAKKASDSEHPTVNADLKNEKVPLKTDTEAVQREAEAMSADGFSAAEQKLLREQSQQFNYQAEVNRLMGIIINSLYSTKEIFLRELISNASDALDKIRFVSLTDPAALNTKNELGIRIKIDEKAGTLTISDSGIGMTRQELIDNLGTVAESGTKKWLDNVETTDDKSLIGQFGVGFYSSFLVADTVTVVSKNNKDDQHVWSSSNASSFTVAKDPRGNTLGRGTSITLHIKDDCVEFLSQTTLRNLITKYSQFINFPIYLWTKKDGEKKEEEAPLDEEVDEEEDLDNNTDDNTKKDQQQDDSEEVTGEEYHWELINTVKPLWTRDPKEITEDEYKEFYKSLSRDTDDPLTWTHFKAEGDLEFKAILYIPSEAPANAFQSDATGSSRGMKLYVRRVFITDDFSVVIPKYLSFIKGVVDSDSLPLNVSREILQQDKSLRLMEKKLVRKAIAMIQQIAEDKEKYNDFYDDFKTFIKLGVVDDDYNRNRLAKLLRYSSSSGEDYVSLEDYIARMKDNQKGIFFLGGESKDFIVKSPLLEAVVAKGYEVLYFTDPLDEYLTQAMPEFEGKKLINIAKEGDLDLYENEEEKEEAKKKAEDYKPLTDFLKRKLSGKIIKAVLSNRFTKTPSALVSSGYSYTANMERILRAQALSTGNVDSFMAPKKVLEINPQHPIIQELWRRVQEDEDDLVASDLAEVLYDTAALQSGFHIDDTSSFARRIHRMMKLSLNLQFDDPVEEQTQDKQEQEKDHTHDEL